MWRTRRLQAQRSCVFSRIFSHEVDRGHHRGSKLGAGALSNRVGQPDQWESADDMNADLSHALTWAFTGTRSALRSA